jgi:uncharacterized Zn finger protein
MTSDINRPSDAGIVPCPVCQHVQPAVTLLTQWLVYLRCDQCGYVWSVAVTEDQTGGAKRRLAENRGETENPAG